MGSNRPIATKEAIADLLAEGLGDHEIAQALGVHERTIDRAMVRHGFRDPQADRRVTPEERARIFQLANEGMIVRWIAEDVGRSEHKVGEIIGPMPERNSEWREIWQQIRRNPELLELHTEFTPTPREVLQA